LEVRQIGGAFLMISFVMGILMLLGAVFVMGFSTYFDPSGVSTLVTAICAIVYIIISVIVLFGVLMAFSGRSWRVAMLGAVLALFTIGPFFIGSICGLIALVLIAVSHDEFSGRSPMMGHRGPSSSPNYRPPPVGKIR
jgi:hypothetical protein